MKKSDFFYDLPEELIAQYPVEPRDSSRLLVYDRKTNNMQHKHFFEIENFLQKGDLLVINNTKVLPVRLYGTKDKTGGKIEFLLLKRIDLKTWEVVLKPGRIAKIGAKFNFGDKLSAKVVDIIEGGMRVVEFEYDGVFEDILNDIGEMPLPHYIKQQIENKERYNTVYAEHTGSSAAPTAGLHFTPQLIQKLKDKGVEFVEVLLHVGLGTFRPVKEDNILNHEMHSEYFEISKYAADTINKAKKEGRRIISVGTTSVRVLESCSDDNGVLKEGAGETKIFIYPGYKFKVVDSLITNFHLPESTLIMLVSALMGRENALNMYETAVKERYRFFSFGDSTFII
ncbi:MAG: tRNA preQ1(34) S-adenosylmethionine ribosyltransferase-isomerase QueA [Clostridia bacterium]|nr:tRNA preQ1(34) S-adenosylmethionine ribosyltransferase-isomerase QueA [Clostridia bacterium]MBR2302737.1 tRNA preQ1(34) S-adenosylmethionine ribosyltransferase-isomerase QueA [Clostridia bacterium]